MKVGFPGGPRLEWYDRNPQHQLNSYVFLQVAPHATTTRWSYTVPSGKKAFIEFITCMVHKSIVSTSADNAVAQIRITPSGGSATIILITLIRTSAVGSRDRGDIGQGPILLAGDLIEAQTYDINADGNVDYAVVSKITEFDA